MAPELELCNHAEAHLRDAQQALLEAAPDMLERCEAGLSQVIDVLQRLAAVPRANRSVDFVAGLRRIRRTARKLRLQAQHGTNLYRGWMQFTVAEGYAADGSPLPAAGGTQMSWEA